MTAIILPEGKQSFTTSAGVPLVGGKLFTWDTGTSNPKLTWADAAQTAPNANPIILDGRGEAVIFWNGAYRVQLQDSTGAIIWTVDGISTQAAAAIASLIPSATNSFDIGSAAFTWRNLYLGPSGNPAVDALGNVGVWVQTPAEAAAVPPVVPAVTTYVPGDVRRLGAAGNGSIAGGTGTNDSAAFISANSVGYTVIASGQKIYRIGANVTLANLYIDYGTTLSIDSGVTLTITGQLECDSALPFAGPGVVRYTTFTRPGRLLNLLPDRAAGVPVRGGCQYHAYGDSYTGGTGVTVVTRFPALLASRWNATENNHGIGGRGITRANLEAYQTLPRYGSRAMLITLLAGFNDLHYGGSNPKTLVKLTSEAQAFLANAFLKTAVPADDASVTKTGAWTNATPGTWADKASQSLGGRAMFSGTNANKISWGFTGTNVVVGYMQGSNTTYTLSTFDVYIDGVFVESIAPNNTTDGNVGFPEVYENLTHAVLLYTNLGGGAHTIELRQTQAVNLLVVDYFGTLSSPGDCPSVLVGEIPHVNAAGYAGPESLRTKVIDDAGSAALRTAVSVFTALGYPVAWIPINDYYDYQANIQGDNDHPNVIGHQQIAAAFSAYTFASNYSLQPSCTFNKAATQAITTATLTALTYSSATDDFFGFRDAVNTSRIYAPFTGTMRLQGTISWAANATGVRDANVYLNGTGVSSGYLHGLGGFAGIDNGFPFCVDIPVVAGDYAEIKVSQNSGGNLNIQTNTRVSAMMIR